MSRGEPVVLLVDDDIDCLTLLGLAIKRLPQRIRFATVQNGEEAMDYLQGAGEFADRTKFPFPNLILLDLKMPRMDGFEVLRWLRGEPTLRHLPVIVLTISSNDADVWRAYQAGANSFLSKGANVPELAEELRSVVDHWLRVALLPEDPQVPSTLLGQVTPPPKGPSEWSD